MKLLSWEQWLEIVGKASKFNYMRFLTAREQKQLFKHGSVSIAIGEERFTLRLLVMRE